MSSILLRGPICGVNNCKSRLWRTIEGQKVCQYGHIRDGDLEIDADDGDVYTQTRRLNLPSLSRSQAQSLGEVKLRKLDESQRLFGTAAKDLYYKCFQWILKVQVRWLIDTKAVPGELEKVVKQLWIGYFQTMTQGYERAKDEDYNILPVLHSVILCYIGCRVLDFPIFANDFIRLCSVGKLPYLRTSNHLPKEYLDQLPTYFWASFDPAHPPNNGEFYSNLQVVLQVLCKTAELKSQIDCLAINYEILLMKILKELMLPKCLYQVVTNYSRSSNLSYVLDISRTKTTAASRSRSIFLSVPEVKLVCLVISFAKVYFSCQQQGDNDDLPWHIWVDRICEKKNFIVQDEEHFEKFLNYLTTNEHKMDELALIQWASDSARLDKYLEWFDSTVVKRPKTSSDYSVSERKLLEIFGDKVELQGSDSPVRTRRNSVLGSTLVEVSADDKILNELEDILVEELSINFGLSPSQLKLCVKYWSDLLICTLLKP